MKAYLDKIEPYRWFEGSCFSLNEITENLARLKIATQLG